MLTELLNRAADYTYRAGLASRIGLTELSETLTNRAAECRTAADELEKDFQ